MEVAWTHSSPSWPISAPHIYARKMGFVPTHALGRTLGERVALEGPNWLNLRFVTPLDIALPMGAPFLVERASIHRKKLGPR